MSAVEGEAEPILRSESSTIVPSFKKKLSTGFFYSPEAHLKDIRPIVILEIKIWRLSKNGRL
jgi:hypothetical protein